MKELELPFTKHDDPVILSFDEEQKKKILKEATDLSMSAQEFYNRLKSNTLEKGFSLTLLSLFESYTFRLHELLDFQSTLRKG